MSKLQLIENQLKNINPSAFQELCDSFLILRNANYSAFSRIGSQSGKQKTIKGTPDTLLLLPNGKYIFVEYSTNVSYKNKLKEDISKCINEGKTHIAIDLIEEIIICINFKLNKDEIEELKNLLINTRIKLSIHTLDSLSLEISLNHRDLSNKYLDIPLDKGQIVSLDTFISEYNNASKNIATPLDNKFFHRENELLELEKALNISDVIILTGAAGVGKTKLALEGINDYIIKNIEYKAFAISNKYDSLLDELYLNLDLNNNNILFIDDANRIDNINQILGFYRTNRSGKLKIILTVRDYSLHEIKNLFFDLNPYNIYLNKLSDNEIREIISAEPFKILNNIFQKKIIDISDGNPRIALMVAKLANEHQNIEILYDVSNTFELYFNTFTKDIIELSNTEYIKALGIISFFYSIPYKDREITIPILNNFELDYHIFIDIIDKLEKLEIVEIQYEYVKISEQNLALFFFYNAVIKGNVIPFYTLLDKYYDKNNNYFKDIIIPLSNSFGYKKILDKVKPDLKNFLRQNINQELKLDFLNTFWFYLQEEGIEYIYDIVSALKYPSIQEYIFDKDKNKYGDKNLIIELIGYLFLYQEDTIGYKNVFKLSFDYIRKKPELYTDLVSKIKQQLPIIGENINRQKILFDVLYEGINCKDSLSKILFFELSNFFLQYDFENSEYGRNNSFTISQHPIYLDKNLKEFRLKIWKTINELTLEHKDKTFEILKKFPFVRLLDGKHVDSCINFDLPLIIEIINKNLCPEIFEDCYLVNSILSNYRISKIKNKEFDTLRKKFTNPTYEIFIKLDWDRLRDKSIFDFDDYNEYNKLKENDIKESFVLNTPLEVTEFYNTFSFLYTKTKNEFNYNNTLDIILNENSLINFDIGCEIIKSIISNSNITSYLPNRFFNNYLIGREKCDKIFKLITQYSYNNKELWLLNFFYILDEESINDQYLAELINLIDNLTEPNYIFFERFEKFRAIKEDLFDVLLRKIVVRNNSGKTNIRIWEDFFSKYIDELGVNVVLIGEAYKQQFAIQDSYDYKKDGLISILKKKNEYLYEFIDFLIEKYSYRLSAKNYDLSRVWEIENIEKELIKTFDLISEKTFMCGISEGFGNAFFIKANINNEYKDRIEKFFFNYCENNINNPERISLLADIAIHRLNFLYNDFLMHYLSINKDLGNFKEIHWVKSGGFYHGDVIVGDIKASKWKEIQNIINKIDDLELLPIKKYINERIESEYDYGNWERKRRFISNR